MRPVQTDLWPQAPGPDFRFEDEARTKGHAVVCGVDEAGRGPWAGPVVAAAVILDRAALPDSLRTRLDDSKKLTEAQREAIFAELPACAGIGVGEASVAEIDEMNILAAALLAMARAVANLPRVPDFALVDGNRTPDLGCACRTIVKGDALSLSISAASIVAKVTRDRMMAELAKTHPGYGWERNKGYGTREHQKGLATLGVTVHHRRSFSPILKILRADSA